MLLMKLPGVILFFKTNEYNITKYIKLKKFVLTIFKKGPPKKVWLAKDEKIKINKKYFSIFLGFFSKPLLVLKYFTHFSMLLLKH